MTTYNFTKGLIGKEDLQLNTTEAYPTETFQRVGQMSTSTMNKFPDIYKTHYAIINACYFNSGNKNDTTLTQAISYIGGNTRTLYLEYGSWSIDNNLTVPANVTLMIEYGAIITIASGKTLTVNGSVLSPARQIFFGTGTATLSQYPQDQAWWGNSQRLDVSDLTVGGSQVAPLTTNEYFKTQNSDSPLTAAQVTGSIVSNYGMTDADCVISLPTAARGYSFLMILPTVRSRSFKLRAAATDKIYLMGVAGADNGYAGVASGYGTGNCAAFFTFKASDGNYDWFCNPIFGTWVAS